MVFKLLSLASLPLVFCLPQTITVNHHAKECLYDLIKEGESVTVSIFILSGAELRGGLLLEGPLSPDNITSGVELQAMIDAFEHSHRNLGPNFRRIEEDVNFEQLASNPWEDGEFEDADDDDVSFDSLDDEHLSEAEIQKRVEERREHARVARQQALEARRKRAERMRASNVVKDGEAVQRTLTAKSTGWYRACVKGNWYQITAELEMRKESDLDGVDPETGHVYSYSSYEELEENLFLDEDTAAEEKGAVNDADFDAVKGKLQELRHLLSDIQHMQSAERRRLTIHAATNEHSHSRMVLSNLFETLLFMLVTGFQIYTIRKWFKEQVLVK